jgi:hypothetical protein
VGKLEARSSQVSAAVVSKLKGLLLEGRCETIGHRLAYKNSDQGNLVPRLFSKFFMASSSSSRPVSAINTDYPRQRQDSMISETRPSPKMESPQAVADAPKPKTLSRVPSKYTYRIHEGYVTLTNH